MSDDHGGVARVGYQDLCVDVTDLEAGAAFLGPLLGLEVQRRRDAVLLLGDDEPRHAVWLNLVSEPRTAKNRVHLDVDVAAVEDVTAAGARVLDASQPWTVLTQAQAGELCAFVRPAERLRPYRLYELVVDCDDPRGLGTWWAERFGVELQDDGEVVWLPGGPDGVPAAGSGLPWELVFAGVPNASGSRTGCTSTSSERPPSSSTPAPRCCAPATTRSPGTCSPIRGQRVLRLRPGGRPRRADPGRPRGRGARPRTLDRDFRGACDRCAERGGTAYRSRARGP